MRSSFWRAAFLAAIAVGFLAAPLAQAQNPTGEIGGSVTDTDGGGLPGVTVTATSPSLQGSRVAVTGSNGTYKLAFLPPGRYTVTFELEGFASANREVRVSAAMAPRLDVQLSIAAVTEEIVVTGEAGTISQSTTGASSYTADEIDQLPVNRDIGSAVRLAPGTSTNPGTGGVQIAGAMSFENLWTLNGVVINENVRGQELPLFIEDALQETTTQVSGISAEYGRFAGGVINAITKSGGNEFTGSFRTSFTNDDWTSENAGALAPDREDEINRTFEATLGGYLWKDHLWFFGAGRDRELSGAQQLNVTRIEVNQTDEQRRLEGKLTGTIADNHTLIGAYLEIDHKRTNNIFFNNIDPAGLTDREDPQDLFSINYTGILTPNFFVEAQYSERNFDIGVGGGAKSRELIEGTLMRSRTGSERYFTPTFCGVCETEQRNNENVLAKGSYFLSTDTLGTHDISFGVDQFSDHRFAINHQTGSDFTVWDTNFTVIGNDIFPTFLPCDSSLPGCGVTTGDNAVVANDTWIGWWAVFNPDQAQTTDFKTNSFYVNDRWQLNDRWSFNLGVRYDENDGENSGGQVTADDSKISPRLGLTWDTRGDGDLVVHASYGTYVAALANTIGDQTSPGGAIGLFLSRYGGPAVNADCGSGGPCLPTGDALAILYDWYLANGGTTDIDGDLSALPNLISVSWPGLTATVPDTINSQAADEVAIGATKRLGNRGLVRADVVRREFDDFYSNRVVGRGADVPFLGQQDLSLVGNFGDDILEREYLGLHLQGRYRLTDRFTVSANYTLSELEGNVVGETGPSGPVSTSPHAYPEYFDRAWAFPVGNLPSDQRHKLRAWAIYDLFDTSRHNLSVSVLQSFDSGNPYSLAGSVNTRSIVGDLNYRTPPTNQTYFFSERGQFTFDDITSTDLSLNYSFLWGAFGRQVEVYLQPEVLNVFNEDGLEAFETRVRTAAANNAVGACPNSGLANGACIPFNPFTETPVEGVHWAKWTHPTLPDFGEPRTEFDYQAPRVYRFSVGFRF